MSGSSRPLIAVLDYGIGNLRSAQKALERVGADARLTDDPLVIDEAAGVVLPGVGAFASCMAALERSKLDDIAQDAATAAVVDLPGSRPFLGICIGLQMLYESSEEAPGVDGLGVLDGWVRRLPDGVRRPQMQWNRLEPTGDHAMLAGMTHPSYVYFVHSYAPDDPSHATATCDYGGPVVASVARGRLWATQFHPEKSASNGLRLLANFVEYCRTAR